MATLRQKRILKRSRLLHKLFNYYVDKFQANDLKIHFSVSEAYGAGGTQRWLGYKNSSIISKLNIIIRPNRIKQLFKENYKDDYYDGRARKLNGALISKKLHYRFILLHELHHAILMDKLGHINFYNLIDYDYERQADDFALAYLMV